MPMPDLWSGFKPAALAVLLSAAIHAQAGRTDRQVPDPSAVDRGKRIYLQFCINCHGSLAQGTDDGPDLIRSNVVLHDNLGSGIGPALKKLAGHTDLTQAQVLDLSHFLKQRVEDTITDRNAAKPPNVLTGDANAGRAYFNGAGKCSMCHSATGDLAGIGKRYDGITLQQRFLFPRQGGRGTPPPKPIEVTVTPPSGPPVSGTLDRIDDFNVSLKDAAGQRQSWRRAPDLKVDINDPYATHNELLDQYTDADMHNIVAYLASLK
jgi:cytochrome c oxidase cbb3-type subunit 3